MWTSRDFTSAFDAQRDSFSTGYRGLANVSTAGWWRRKPWKV